MLLAEKIADVANLTTAAVVVGFVIGEQEASGPMAVIAGCLWVATLAFSAWIAKDKE